MARRLDIPSAHLVPDCPKDNAMKSLLFYMRVLSKLIRIGVMTIMCYDEKVYIRIDYVLISKYNILSVVSYGHTKSRFSMYFLCYFKLVIYKG